MPTKIKLKRGFDIRLQGEADPNKVTRATSDLYAVKPTDFRALAPKLEVKAGDRVRAGDPLFSDKYRPEVKFTSPVSGIVEEVRRGEKRRVMAVVVRADEQIAYKPFDAPSLDRLTKEGLIALLLESGLWPLIKQRPYDIVADPGARPKGIFATAFDSAPLAPDYRLLLKDDARALEAGLEALGKLAPLHVNAREDQASVLPARLPAGARVHFFEGPHPAGNAGVQIHHLAPLGKGETAWTISLPDAALVGRLLLEGRVDARKRVAITGPEVTGPGYAETIAGARVGCLAEGGEGRRMISGNALTGDRVEEDDFLGFYHRQVTVIAEGNRPEFLGWALPGFGKLSMSRTFPAFLFPRRRYRADTNLRGEERAFVVSGQYEKVLPMDVLPVYLLKAILAGNVEKMEQLGIYEVAPEDLALCEFACTSKVPVQEIVARGIALMMKELS